MNEWFPLGVVPRMFDITKEFFKLPFHVRLQIMNSLGAPVEDETFVEAVKYLREKNLLSEYITAIRDKARERQHEDVRD